MATALADLPFETVVARAARCTACPLFRDEAFCADIRRAVEALR